MNRLRRPPAARRAGLEDGGTPPPPLAARREPPATGAAAAGRRPAGFVWHRKATWVRMAVDTSPPTRPRDRGTLSTTRRPEKVTMGIISRGTRGVWVLAAGALLAGLFGVPLQGEETLASEKADEAALRKKALALNDFTGAEPMEGRLQQLI